MAQKPPKGPIARSVTNEALQAKVEIDLSDAAMRLRNRAVELLTDGPQRGLTGEALAEFVDERLVLSKTPIEQAGRGATSEAHNLGRNLGAQQRLSEIGQVVRSALLDENTCSNCKDVDQAVVQINGPVVSISAAGAALLRDNGVDPDSPDAYFALMPPNFCKGEDFCRCLLIYRRAAA